MGQYLGFGTASANNRSVLECVNGNPQVFRMLDTESVLSRSTVNVVEEDYVTLTLSESLQAQLKQIVPDNITVSLLLISW